jgi:hypothetical protein
MEAELPVCDALPTEAESNACRARVMGEFVAAESELNQEMDRERQLARNKLETIDLSEQAAVIFFGLRRYYH